MTKFRMSKRPIWYHDFADLGFPTRVIDSSYAQAQALKVGPFVRQFSRAMAGRADSELSSIQGLELFCADAYFSQYAILNGIGRMVGIDLDIESPEKRGGSSSKLRLPLPLWAQPTASRPSGEMS